MTPARKKMYEKAYEAGRQDREQYIAAKRPVLRLRFRHECPTMSEEEIDILVNDARLRTGYGKRPSAAVPGPS